MTNLDPRAAPFVPGFYAHDPYATTRRRILPISDTQRLVMSTLSAFHMLVFQKDAAFVWTAGSASTVRLQSLLLANEPELYQKVVVELYSGTIQTFLSDVMHVNLFFYDAHDFEEYPVLANLVSPHEGRCSMLPKEAARLFDVHVAHCWTSTFVPLSLRDLVATVLHGGGTASLEQVGAAGAGGPPLPMRDSVAHVLAICATFCPFTHLISRKKLKDAVQITVRQMTQPALAANRSCFSSAASDLPQAFVSVICNASCG